MDYDGDSTDSLEFSAVATSNAAPALMMATTRSAKLAADIPACTNAPTELLARFTREAVAMDPGDAETLAVARGTLTGHDRGLPAHRQGQPRARRMAGRNLHQPRGCATYSSPRWPPPAPTLVKSVPR